MRKKDHPRDDFHVISSSRTRAHTRIEHYRTCISRVRWRRSFSVPVIELVVSVVVRRRWRPVRHENTFAALPKLWSRVKMLKRAATRAERLIWHLIRNKWRRIERLTLIFRSKEKREEDEPSNFRVVIFGDERRDPAEVSGPILSRIFIFGQSWNLSPPRFLDISSLSWLSFHSNKRRIQVTLKSINSSRVFEKCND